MYSPLLQSIIERENLPVLTLHTVDEFLANNGDVALFFTGAYERLVEVNDVAVIFPELIKAFGDRITPAVVARDAERDLQRRYLFNAFPTLVFLREGAYLGVISKVLDWQEYLDAINEILAREPTEPPPFEFPEGCYQSGMKR